MINKATLKKNMFIHKEKLLCMNDYNDSILIHQIREVHA